MSVTEIKAIPQNVAGTPSIVTVLNDRIRAINLNFAAQSSAAPDAKEVLYGTHAQRVGRPTPGDGTIFIESDTGLTYQVQGTVWHYLSGTFRVTNAQIPATVATLGKNDVGVLIYTTDSKLLYRWDGAALVRQDNYEPTLAGTHHDRLNAFPSVAYGLNQEFQETDRGTRYIVADSIGTLTVTGGVNVTWNTGSKFINSGSGWTAAQWPAGTVITINGLKCTIAVVLSETTLTLQAATLNVSGVLYTVASGRWQYLSGRASGISLPGDLGENDYGFLFLDSTHWRVFEFVSTGGAPAVSSPGWQRGAGELPTGALQILPFGPGQFATGWTKCDGTAGVSITQDDGTTTVVTTPGMVGAYPKGGLVSGYTGVQNAAVDTILNPYTPAGTVGASEGGVSVAPGSGSAGDGAITASFGGIAAAPTVATEGEPVNVVVPWFMKR